jgi:hypothetical protein
VANHNRNRKLIWSIEHESEGIIRGQAALKSEAASYFEKLYKANSELSLPKKISTASLYTNWVSEAEAADLFIPVTLSELKTTLSLLQKEKSPGPDGWTAEFFSHYFDLVGTDLLQMIEDTRITGKISSSLNSTFLVLIPKSDQPSSYNDFRPISLCNLVYKLIAKVISTRIKPVMERKLSPEQLGFLKGRRIHDAIGVAHESIHSIFHKKQKAMIMKIDLKKAFDSVDWDYLRLILLSVGFGLNFTNWIMSCVSSANLSVLINGEASRFFKSERGLRQGCPLSPYLFILVLEGLSLLLSKSVAEHLFLVYRFQNISGSSILCLWTIYFYSLLLMNRNGLLFWIYYRFSARLRGCPSIPRSPRSIIGD